LTRIAVLSTDKEQILRHTQDRNIRKVTPDSGIIIQPPVETTEGVGTTTSEPSISARTHSEALMSSRCVGIIMRITAHVRSRKQELYAYLNLFETPTPPESAIPWYDNHFYPVQCVQTFALLGCALRIKKKNQEMKKKKKCPLIVVLLWI